MFVYDEQVKRGLRELSDLQLQEKLWLSGQGEFSSFTEAVEQLFTDTGLGIALERNEIPYGEPLDSMLRRLSAVVDKIDERRPPMAIISDPLMDEVRTLSSEILRQMA